MINEEMTLEEIVQMRGFNEFERYLFQCRDETWEKMKKIKLKDTLGNVEGRDVDFIVNGLRQMEDNISSGIRVCENLYSEDEIREDQSKETVKLFFFPGRKGAPFVLICPGGGYRSVCSYQEGFPSAAALSKEGYNAFILSYRVRLERYADKPIHDLERAIRHILSHKKEYEVSEHYALMGFSAGGHLAAEMGTDNLGYMNYGLPKPDAMLLCYPVLLVEKSNRLDASVNQFYDTFESENGNGMEDHSVEKHMSEKYPPVFIWQMMDDFVIPIYQQEKVCQKLISCHVPYEYLVFDVGNHALTQKHPTKYNRWIRHCICFLQTFLSEE